MTTSLNSAVTLWIIGATSLLAFFTSLPKLKLVSITKIALYETLSRHWKFGSWLMVSNSIHWSGTQGLLMLAGALLGTSTVGGIRAVINLTAPVNIIMLGLHNILPARASQLLSEAGHTAMVRYLLHSMSNIMAGLGIICTSIVLLQDTLMQLFYGLTYATYTHLVFWQCIYFMIGGLLFPLSIYYRSMEKTRTYALCLLTAAPSAIAVTWLLLPLLEARAVFVGLIVNQVLSLLSVAITLQFVYGKKSSGKTTHE